MELRDRIRAYALENAVKFSGKASTGSIVGRILGDNPELKKDMKSLNKDIRLAVDEVNSMQPEQQKKELEKFSSFLAKEPKPEKKDKELKELPGAKGKVVMRMAPSPSGPLHIGHAYVTSLNYEYVRKYGGKFMLRIEDTNPDNIYPPAYDMIPEDANWLCNNNVDEVIVQSDRMEVYYNYALKLIEEGHMYVCTCEPEEFRKYMAEKIACPCRELSPEENVKRWHKMFSEYQQGEAVVRFKTDVKHKNPAMRDFPMLRIKETPHPRAGSKYRVWPLLNFSVSIDDLEFGVTHTLRGKDHADNAIRQEMIHKALKFQTPVAVSVGRINFEGFEVSCTKTREKIEQGIYSGWDDIRIPFLRALKRRGYQPEAFRKYAIDVGISQNDKTVEISEFFKTINAFNREILEKKANRHFFIAEPVAVKICNAPEQDISLNLHPDYPGRGVRSFRAHEDFYVSKEDLDGINEGTLVRLMDCLNFKKRGSGFMFDSLDYEKYKKEGSKIIHWLPKGRGLVNIEVLMPDNTTVKGLGEQQILALKEGDICQFERFGFVRLDRKEKERLIFWFAHR